MKYTEETLCGNFRRFGFRIYTENHTNEDNFGGAAKLFWTDYVANDWEEEFPTVSDALGRVALLRACEESNFEKYFVNSPENFVDNFAEFAKQELADPYQNTLGIVALLNMKEPRFTWELIPTGGGCNAIVGKDTDEIFHISITDGDGQSPISISQKAKAIFEENTGTRIREIHETDFVKLEDLLPLISAQITKQNQLEKLEDLLSNLAELADFLENNRLPQISDNARGKYSRDLQEAVYLINTHTKEN
jgi:hypothetical protein